MGKSQEFESPWLRNFQESLRVKLIRFFVIEGAALKQFLTQNECKGPFKNHRGEGVFKVVTSSQKKIVNNYFLLFSDLFLIYNSFYPIYMTKWTTTDRVIPGVPIVKDPAKSNPSINQPLIWPECSHEFWYKPAPPPPPGSYGPLKSH